MCIIQSELITPTAKPESPHKKTAILADGGIVRLDCLYLIGTVIAVAVELLLFSFAAGGAAKRFVGQTLLFVELLFAFGEGEFLRAVFANQSFIWHGFLLVG